MICKGMMTSNEGREGGPGIGMRYKRERERIDRINENVIGDYEALKECWGLALLFFE